MEERGAVGWVWGVQLEQHQLKVAGGETLERAGRAKACRLAWGLPLCVTKALSVCTLKDPLVCRRGHRHTRVLATQGSSWTASQARQRRPEQEDPTRAMEAGHCTDPVP